MQVKSGSVVLILKYKLHGTDFWLISIISLFDSNVKHLILNKVLFAFFVLSNEKYHGENWITEFNETSSAIIWLFVQFIFDIEAYVDAMCHNVMYVF